MNPGGNDSEDGSSSSDGDDADEIARFEEDTESFMLRKREFQFPGIPAGASDNQDTRRAVVVSIRVPSRRSLAVSTTSGVAFLFESAFARQLGGCGNGCRW